MHSRLIAPVVTAALCFLVLDAKRARCDEAKEKAPNEAASTKARQTIERGLTFLEKDTLVWRKEHQCATCHHGTMTVWVLSEAKSRGHAVKPEFLADVTDWTKERLVKVRAEESAEALRPAIDRFLGHQNKDGGWGQPRDKPTFPRDTPSRSPRRARVRERGPGRPALSGPRVRP